jgi:hypothetical protein
MAIPILFAISLGSALGVFPGGTRTFVVQTPMVSETYRWEVFALWSFGPRDLPARGRAWLRHFLFSFLPGLAQAAAGRMGFVGPRALTKEELQKLDESDRSIYLLSRPGLLQPDLIGSTEQNGAPETGWHQAISVVSRYAGLVLRSCFTATAGDAPQ